MSSRKVREKLREAKIARDVALDKKRHNEFLASLTKADLIKYAEDKGIEIDKTAKKAEILNKIKE